MKKFTLFAALACAMLATPLAAQTNYSPSASDKIFDLAPYGDVNMLNLFVKALENGRQYPTMEEFEAAGFNKSDIEFWRSHVRPRPVIRDKATQLYPNLSPYRNLWLNIPSGAAKGTGGFPSSNTGDDTFTMWNYTHLFGNWNHGLFSGPGCWTDAAHKHGTDIFSGIKFFESWTPGSGDQNYTRFISVKNNDGSYKYVKPLINCLMYFGWDGINYNWEDRSYTQPDVVAFHKALYKEAEAQGLTNFHAGLYTQRATLTRGEADKMYGTKENGKTFDLMLNYMADDFTTTAASSDNVAVDLLGHSRDLYMSAWIVNLNRSWNRIPKDKEIGICLWGEHAMSRWYSYNKGNDAVDFEHNLQRLYERTLSGGNQNPADLLPITERGIEWEGDNPLGTFHGLAHWIAERSSVQGKLPFYTYFNIGSGERYNYKGKKTAGGWYNMSSQDMMPTYRWLVYKMGTKEVSKELMPSFSLKDAYMGGSSLLLKGQATAQGSDLILYRTKLTGNSGTPMAKVAVKQAKAGATHLQLLVVTADGTQHRFPVGATTGTTWEEKSLKLEGLSGQEIAQLGFTTQGAGEELNLYVGELQINDDVKAMPATPKDLVVEVKEETTQSLSIKANWGLEAQGKSKHAVKGLVYNDEANVDHFEVVYKSSKDEQPVVVSKVSSWAAFVGNIKLDKESDMPYIGVRSVSTDLKTYSPVLWVAVPRSANVPTYKPRFGVSQINQSSEGYQTALKSRFFDAVKTEGASGANLDYTYKRSEPYTAVDSTNYVDATDHVLRVKQGDKIKLTYTMNGGGDNLIWCIMKAYVDYNGNQMFDAGTDEVIAEQGISKPGSGNPLTHGQKGNTYYLTPFEFTIPQDARTGKSCLRFVFSDAWFAHPGPTGFTSKGYTLDLGVEISGTNEQRPVPITNHDQGKADAPDAYKEITLSIAKPQLVASQVKVEGKTLNFTNVEKAWIFTLDGRLVKYLPAAAAVEMLNEAPGTYIVKMQHNNVIRSAKVQLQ